RIDHQVKIRGFRIELGEIEAVLRTHPNVRDGVVVVREDAPGARSLAAYIVPAGPGSEALAESLRAFLGARLPAYMVPPAIVLPHALPLSPNGKVDRRRLPAPDRVQRKREIAPPRTPTEETVAAIWRDLLGREEIGVDESFFALGGHSLLATQAL